MRKVFTLFSKIVYYKMKNILLQKNILRKGFMKMKKKWGLVFVLFVIVSTICVAQTSEDRQRLVGTWVVVDGLAAAVGASYVFRADGTYTWTGSTPHQTGFWGIGGGGTTTIYFIADENVNNNRHPWIWNFSISPDGKFLHTFRQDARGDTTILILRRQ